jgi:cytochrome c oxidase cbb3-type subunit III
MYSRCRKADLYSAALLAAAAALGGCSKSAETQVPQAPPGQASIQGTPISPLFPGGGSAPPEDPLAAQYANDEHAKTDGKRLYDWYNCSGCHFHGAGGIGPSLGDNDWIYGGGMQQIYSSIYQGRPNGMPSWGEKLSSTEIWEIAAYVHSMPNTDDFTSSDAVPPLPAVREEDARMPQIPDSPSANP